MGKRGPKPKPTVLKIMAGNPGKRPLNAQESRPSSADLRPPDWLDDAAKAKWEALAPELSRLGLLTAADVDTFAAYCQAWAEFRAATMQIAKEGRTTKARKGQRQYPHPAVAQQRTAIQAMRQLGSLFGLDPASRASFKQPPQPQVDELEAFLVDAN